MTVRRIEGELPVAFRYTPGVGNTAFFEALRDRGTFLGSRCADCGVTYLPARIFCERCLAGLVPDTECGPEGTVESWTVARRDIDGSPLDPPLTFSPAAGQLGPEDHHAGQLYSVLPSPGNSIRALA